MREHVFQNGTVEPSLHTHKLLTLMQAVIARAGMRLTTLLSRTGEKLSRITSVVVRPDLIFSMRCLKIGA